MHIQEVTFMGSFPKFAKLPSTDFAEICFWGRSNVGKSSLINSLCNRKEIAKVSSTPGKTQHFNLFTIDDQWCMMDLPGYGYARVSKSVKSSWEKEIDRYLKQRENLILVCLLVDISITPQQIDLLKMEFLGTNQIPFYIVFTKSDRCTKGQLKFNISEYEKTLGNTWENLPTLIITESITRLGTADLLQNIDRVLKNYYASV